MMCRFPIFRLFAVLLFMAPIACDPGDSGTDPSDASDASDAADTTDTTDPTDATDGSDPTDTSDPSVGSDTSDPSEPVDGRISVSATVVDDSITGLQTVEVEVTIQDESGKVLITNDGATILKMMSVIHPTARMLVEISKA